MPELSIFSWNINGIRAAINSGALQSFIDRYHPDILCLQEVRAHESQTDTPFPQYIEYWNSAVKSSYSGTAIFTRRDPIRVVKQIPEDIATRFSFHNDPFGNPNDEGRLMAAEFQDFWLVTVYTPNSKPDLSRLSLRRDEWDPAVLAYCKHLEQTKPVILCGDLNVAHTEDDLSNPQSHLGAHGFTDEERKGFQNILDAGLVDTFRMFTKGPGHHTWWSNFSNSRARNLGWRIDYFLVSQALQSRVSSASIHAEVMGSDHCPVSITLNL